MNMADRITDAELEIMRVLWSGKTPMTSMEIQDRLRERSTWEKSTILTLIRRLVRKGIVSCSREDHLRYTPLITEQEFRASHTRTFLNRFYGGSVRNLVLALYDGGMLTPQEKEELQAYLNEGGSHA